MFYIDLFMKFVQGNLIKQYDTLLTYDAIYFSYFPRIFDIIIETHAKYS